MSPFLVCEFEKQTISNLVKECFGSEFPEIFSKRQVDYVYRYLNDLGARTVVLEPEYIDKDYLDDFSKFYVRRFNSEGHKCARLHFFGDPWTHQTIENILTSGTKTERDDFRAAYLGYMVVKPLPKTFIGRTCLKTYDTVDSKLKRTYDVCLFGINLRVDTVAFQEQDKVVSACATTALWSALHGAHWVPLSTIPSCSQITTNAINHISDSSNSFPNNSLSNKQILRALDVSGQKHHQHSLTETKSFEAIQLIQSYLSSRLPLILGGVVYKLKKGGEPEELDGHAITILGARITQEEQFLFVHDDRLGPFARVRIVMTANYFSGGVPDGLPEWSIVLQAKEDGEWRDPEELIAPKTLIAISPRKVGLPIRLCTNTCERIVNIYRSAARAAAELKQAESAENEVSYDFSLMQVGAIKAYVLDLPLCDGDSALEHLKPLGIPQGPAALKASFLTKSMAKHQWCARFYYRSRLALIVLFDTTDIAQGDAVSAIYPADPEGAAAIVTAVKVASRSKRNPVFGREDNFIASFLRRVTPTSSDLSAHLDLYFGQPRAPSKLKRPEIEGGSVRQNPEVKPFYEATPEPLRDIYPDLYDNPERRKIWVVDCDGTLLIGEEIEGLGHPTLTGFRPARIGGELWFAEGKWRINAKSGRYSKNYDNSNDLLTNALERFKGIFPTSRGELVCELHE